MLEGKFERLGTGPIVVWERANGDREVITGRHRLDLARRSGENTIPAQVVREIDGFTREMALVFDAESNIRDGQGATRDYAHYFRNANIGEAEARQRGLLSRAKGQDGWALGRNASNDLYDAYRNRGVTERGAVAIANAAPGNEAAQRVGLRYAQANPRAHHQDIGNAVQVAVVMGGKQTGGIQTDLFGNVLDDSFLAEMARRAKIASEQQRQVGEQLRILKAARIDPEKARSLGIDIKVSDPASIAQERQRLNVLQERWKEWHTDPELRAVVMGEDSARGVQQTIPAEPVKETGDLFGEGQPEIGQTEFASLAPRPPARGFPRAVTDVAGRTTTGRFGEDLVFISHLYDTYARENPGKPMSLAEFKGKLVEAHRAGDIELVRADLVSAMDPKDVQASRTEYLNATFHMMRAPKGAKARETQSATQTQPPRVDEQRLRSAAAKAGYTYVGMDQQGRPLIKNDATGRTTHITGNPFPVLQRLAIQRSAPTSAKPTPQDRARQESNILRGEESMGRVIETQSDVFDAMEREDTGPVSFVWGQPGDPQRAFKGGFGVSHIVAKRTAEGADGDAVAQAMVETIALGQKTREWGPEGGQRVEIKHGPHTAILSLYRDGQEQTWLLTGWKEDGPSATGEAYDSAGATQPGPTRFRSGPAGPSSTSVPQSSESGKTKQSEAAIPPLGEFEAGFA